ncbi:MAG: leucine-rich repeat domain-containing protein [Prevotella sp.]|nr:leucine-rich repeat domain-containing protein [Prevotella sp.]
MKKINNTILLTMLMSMIGLNSSAHDIEVKNADGVTIYYKWTNNNTELSVTFRGSYTSSYSYEYTGNVVIPESVTYNSKTYSVTSIGQYAFYECSGLTSVTIPNSVTSIGGNAFYNAHLKSITIGSGVLSIGSAISSTKVIWLTNTPPSGYKNVTASAHYVANDLYTSLNNKTVYPFLSSIFEVGGIKYVPVSPSERTCDAIDCVYDATAENITIGESVTNKGVSLKIQKLQPDVCYSNTHIKSVNIESGFKGDIPHSSFSYCSGINSATIGNQGSIDSRAFKNCYSLQTVELGNNITTIDEEAFCGTALRSIIIPNSVQNLGKKAFSGCSKMTSAKIGNGIEILNYLTFAGCTSLVDVTIGTRVKTIDGSALSYGCFKGCSALSEINIPKNVTAINNSVFEGCTSLKKVTMEDSEEELFLGENDSSPLFSDCPLDEVYIGRNISYNQSPFRRNTSLRSVTITDKETEISENEFYGCTNLKEVKIGDGVTDIGNWAFSGCSSLDYFSFGSAVSEIGQEAFSDCTAMTKLITKAMTPPNCLSQALDDINKWNCTLHVPKGTTPLYQQAAQWKEFFFIDDDAPTAINNVNGNENIKLKVKSTFSIDGKAISQPQKGMNIQKMSDGTSRKIVVD